MTLLIALIALGILQPTPVFASAFPATHLEYSPASAEIIVRAYAVKWGVSGDEMWATTLCENASLDPTKQSKILDESGPNGREDSWGNSQINLHWHPEISKTQAQDPFFSADFMGEQFSKGKQHEWSCYKSKTYLRLLAAIKSVQLL